MVNRTSSATDESVDVASTSGSDTGFVRLNVNLNAETAAALKKIAKERDISFTEAVRRAIAVYNFIDEETRRGRKIQTTDAEHTTVRELVLV